MSAGDIGLVELTLSVLIAEWWRGLMAATK